MSLAPEPGWDGAGAPSPAPATPELSVVVPSFNERGNIEALVGRLAHCLDGIAWEVIYVDDDSPDGTAELVQALARRDPRVRCLRRIGRRGLSTAVIEGILSSSAPYVAVIDADLQHDESLLPRMLAEAKRGGLDVVVGSRYAAGGSARALDPNRAAISGFATRLSRLVVPDELADPMSGFFLITRPAFDRAVRRLSGQGFKILLDLFASTPSPFRFAELPYEFRARLHGESKLDSLVAWEYLMLLLDKLFGRIVPTRFVLFGLVGATGVVVHLATLRLMLTAAPFAAAQATGTLVAMTSNYALNNIFTYRDKRLRGRRFLTGLLSFYAICSLGAVANVAIASAAYEHRYSWWFAGLSGAVVGVVWNYAVSSVFTWRSR